MSLSRPLPLLISLCAMACLALVAEPAHACSVCYGNADSSMVHGAQAGVLFLGAVVYGQIMLMGGVGVFWFVRARRLAREQALADASKSFES